MLQSVRTSFRILLEKPQPQLELGHPTDLYVAEYCQGEKPELDSLRKMRVLADSSSDERFPIGLPEGGVAFHSLRGRPGIYRIEGQETQPVLLRPRIQHFAVSPDGQDWAFVSDQKLYRYRQGKVTPCDLPEHKPREVTFAPDGSLLFLDEQGLFRACGLAEGPTLLAPGLFSEVALSPDGSRMVYVRGDDRGDQLRLLELASGEDQLLRHSADEPGVCQYPSYERPNFSPDGSRLLYSVSSQDGPWGPTVQSDLRVISSQGGEPTVLCDDVLSAACG